LQRVEVSNVRRVVTIHDDPLGYFVSRYDEETQPVAGSQIRKFFAWLNQRDGWAGVGPKQLLIRQLQAEDLYEIPELIQDFVNSRRDLRKGTIRNRVSFILEFFRKNRCLLPEGVDWKWFKVRSTVPPVQGQLTAAVIKDAVGGLPLRWCSLYLVKYQAFLDTKRLWWLKG